MPETLKDRSQLDPRFTWDLSRLFADAAAWEQAFAGIDAGIAAAAAFAGRLNEAPVILQYLQASTALSRKLSDLYCYASMRHSEDTRAEAAQSMYARISAKCAAAVAALSFAEPEMLALPEATLRAMAEDARLADYRFALQDLLRQKPHTLTAPEEKLLASFSEVAGAPSEIADALQDADLVFEPVADAAGEQHEVTGSNYILLQTSPDRTLRENSFRSYYKSYRQHINTFAAAYAGGGQGGHGRSGGPALSVLPRHGDGGGEHPRGGLRQPCVDRARPPAGHVPLCGAAQAAARPGGAALL